MLYIKKTNLPVNINNIISNIKSTPEWQTIRNGDTATIRTLFDLLPKDGIRVALLKEQHYLCAYCMKRIENDPLHMAIEHLVPLSKDKEKALDYNNFLGVCKGGADVSVNKKRVLCCDGSKGDYDQMSIDPLSTKMMDQVAYLSDGTIYFMPSSCWDDVTVKQIEKDINDTLCLNGIRGKDGALIADTATCLVKNRRDTVKQASTIVDHLRKKSHLTSNNLQKEIVKIQGEAELPEFAGTIIFFLRRKYKNLVSQGK